MFNQLFGTAKTHKFERISDITLGQLKLRPVIDQTWTHTYKASKVVAKYLSPLAKNDYTIIGDIILEQLKLCPITDRTETYIYKASKVVAKYISLLAKTIILQ